MKIHMSKKTLAELKSFCKQNGILSTATVCYDNDTKKVVWHIGTGLNWQLYTYICQLSGASDVISEITYHLEREGHELELA